MPPPLMNNKQLGKGVDREATWLLQCLLVILLSLIFCLFTQGLLTIPMRIDAIVQFFPFL